MAWLNGCSGRTPAPPSYPPAYPLGFVERGSASWYGPGFHGNRTANGELYDMHKLTAAHRTLPLGSVAVVRSLTNGRQVTVRINDDGTVLWNDMAMSMPQIDYQLRQAATQNPQPQIMISAGDRSRYQVLAQVMTRAKNAKVTKIGFDNTQR